MPSYNPLMGTMPRSVAEEAPPATATRPVPAGPPGAVRENPPLVLALIVVGSIGVLAALQLGGFRGTIAVGRV